MSGPVGYLFVRGAVNTKRQPAETLQKPQDQGRDE